MAVDAIRGVKTLAEWAKGRDAYPTRIDDWKSHWIVQSAGSCADAGRND